MPVVTDVLLRQSRVTVSVTYNTANPGNIQQATCVNGEAFPVVLLIGWHDGTPNTRLTIPANSTQSMNPTAAESTNLASVSVEFPPAA